ncbi:hypothetical protein A8W25_01210 [Streptomyces sp. ERV7]|uniref:SDR family NAD(P)-dependent oxidoreductase n=1 Tax=Streptomyces sp. ERV7 TaxID=1322334 RepID=UPI0007F54285|nr:SDR family NAD(P)-dependent oxidoreductase [Streptomyces sp. ERV7]OAR26940.1 hypothetical protein A8W25_01210 [Streptomyces sp. ERV7]
MATILITGSSAGIGAAAAVRLTKEGHQVFITGRSPEKLTAVHRRLLSVAPAGAKVPNPIPADLSSLHSVRSLAETILLRAGRLDVLVNNAAVQPPRRRFSEDGFELGFAVNHLAHFLLTGLLAERLRANGGRVVNTSSDEHAAGRLDLDDLNMDTQWTSALSYRRSKLANVLFTTELRKQLGLPASSFHPGSISTDLNRDAPFVRLIKPFERLIMKKPEEGATTLVWLATDPEGAEPTADYYVDRRPAETGQAARDPHTAARLWDISARLSG